MGQNLEDYNTTEVHIYQPSKKFLERESQENPLPFAKVAAKHISSTGSLDKVVVNPLNKPDQDNHNVILSGENSVMEKSNDGTSLARHKKLLPPISKQINNEKSSVVEVKGRKVGHPEKNTNTQGEKIKILENAPLPPSNSHLQRIKILPKDQNFIFNPILPQFILQGTVNRIRIDKKQSHNQYQYCVSESKQQMLMAIPTPYITNSLYEIKRDGEVVATLQSNFTGSRFQLKNKQSDEIICIIQYKMNVCTGAETRVFRATITRESLELETKLPKYNEAIKKYTMSFYQRASLPSLKNFILTDSTPENRNVVLLGKVTQDGFSLDVSAGVSPLEAFGIALSSFDPKLICE